MSSKIIDKPAKKPTSKPSNKIASEQDKNHQLITTSPCVGVCSTSFGDDICYGCRRTSDEVINWNTMDDESKDKINRRLLETS